MTSTSVLRVDRLSHVFDGRDALKTVSLTVAKGEIVAVVGPSGCGKTTLLRACAGLLEPTGGAVTAATARRSFVFQEPALLPWRRVAGNAALFVDDAATDHVAHLLGVSGLAEHADKWPYQLSGGMKMRLSVVRALATQPELLLLDEPFGSLDQITRQRLHDELLALHSEFAFSAIVVTHSLDEAVYLADRVLVMSAAPGRIVGEFPVPFARRRDDSLRYTPEFAVLCGRVAACLREHSR